jgi:hypothetical protein
VYIVGTHHELKPNIVCYTCLYNLYRLYSCHLYMKLIGFRI